MAKSQLLRLKRATRNMLLAHAGVPELRFADAPGQQLDLDEGEWFSTFVDGLAILDRLRIEGSFPKPGNYRTAVKLLEAAGLPYDQTELYMWIVGHGRQYEGEVFADDVTLHLPKGTAWPLTFARFAKHGGTAISGVLNTLDEVFGGLNDAVMKGLCTAEEACRLMAQAYENGFALDEVDNQRQYSLLPAELRRRLNTVISAFEGAISVSCPLAHRMDNCRSAKVDARTALQGIRLNDFQAVVLTLAPKAKMRLEVIPVAVDPGQPIAFCWHATSGEQVPATTFSDLNGGAKILDEIRAAGGFNNEREYMRTFQLLTQVPYKMTAVPTPAPMAAPNNDGPSDAPEAIVTQAPAPDASADDKGDAPDASGTGDQPVESAPTAG